MTGEQKIDFITRGIVSLLLLPAFFPYVGIVPGVDLQPNSLLAMIALLVLILSSTAINVRPLFLNILLATLVVAVGRVAVQLAVGDASSDTSATVLAFAQTSFHLVTILVAYLVVRAGVFRPTSGLIGTVTLVYILVAVIQLLVNEQFGSSLVYRGYQELTATGRGVRSLASEPAVFGNMLLILSGFWMLIAATQGWSARRFLFVQAMLFVATALLSQSTYAILQQAAVFSVCVLVVSKRMFVMLCLAVGWLIIAFVLQIQAQGIRVVFILQTLLQNPVLLYEQGAMLRVMNVPISVYGGMLHGLFGAGFGGQEVVSGFIPALPGNPFPFEVADRNLGGAVELFLRLGIGALPLLAFILVKTIAIGTYDCALGASRVRIGLPLAIVIFLTVFTYSSIGNPLIWLLLFSAMAYRRTKRIGALGATSGGASLA